jgi:gamma-glutamylcyclotransferase (GGCT)/AIG2-like uncharacterized protein YtfP
LKEFLFSYGTLQKEKVQLELFGRLLDGTKDILEGYQLASIEIKDQAFLAKGEEQYQLTAIPSNNNADLIEGTVFEISEADLILADVYEPNNYEKTRVTLQSGKEAWIYVAV